MYIAGQGQTTSGDKILMSAETSLVTSVICYKFKKKSLWSLILYNFFHDFIHVYSPGTGADNPLGMKFWCQKEHLVTSVICCKFKKKVFEVWFYTKKKSWFNTCIQPWDRQPPGDKILMSTERPYHFTHLLQASNKSLWSLILFIFFHDLIRI